MPIVDNGSIVSLSNSKWFSQEDGTYARKVEVTWATAKSARELRTDYLAVTIGCYQPQISLAIKELDRIISVEERGPKEKPRTHTNKILAIWERQGRLANGLTPEDAKILAQYDDTFCLERFISLLPIQSKSSLDVAKELEKAFIKEWGLPKFKKQLDYLREYYSLDSKADLFALAKAIQDERNLIERLQKETPAVPAKEVELKTKRRSTMRSIDTSGEYFTKTVREKFLEDKLFLVNGEGVCAVNSYVQDGTMAKLRQAATVEKERGNPNEVFTNLMLAVWKLRGRKLGPLERRILREHDQIFDLEEALLEISPLDVEMTSPNIRARLVNPDAKENLVPTWEALKKYHGIPDGGYEVAPEFIKRNREGLEFAKEAALTPAQTAETPEAKTTDEKVNLAPAPIAAPPMGDPVKNEKQTEADKPENKEPSHNQSLVGNPDVKPLDANGNGKANGNELIFSGDLKMATAMKMAEIKHIRDVLGNCNGDVAAAAQALKISQDSLRVKLSRVTDEPGIHESNGKKSANGMGNLSLTAVF